jgi:hypothetical protein
MILTAFTVFHVLLSLVGIGSGFAVVYGLLAGKWPAVGTKLFLISTIATSMTGFFFPFHGFTPAIGVGILSLIVLLVTCVAFSRSWRRTFAITAMIALYFNVFVLVVQLFRKVPALTAIAPTQSEPPFQITQMVVLAAFVVIGFLAAKKPGGSSNRGATPAGALR